MAKTKSDEISPLYAVVKLRPLSMYRVAILHLQQYIWIRRQQKARKIKTADGASYEPYILERANRLRSYLFFETTPLLLVIMLFIKKTFNRMLIRLINKDLLGGFNVEDRIKSSGWGYLVYGHRFAWKIKVWDADNEYMTAQVLQEQCPGEVNRFTANFGEKYPLSWFEGALRVLFTRRVQNIYVVLTILGGKVKKSVPYMVGNKIISTGSNDVIWDIPTKNGQTNVVMNIVSNVRIYDNQEVVSAFKKGVSIRNLVETIPVVAWHAVNWNIVYQTSTYTGVGYFSGDHSWGRFNGPLWIFVLSYAWVFLRHFPPSYLPFVEIKKWIIEWLPFETTTIWDRLIVIRKFFYAGPEWNSYILLKCLLVSTLLGSLIYILHSMFILMGHWQEGRLQKILNANLEIQPDVYVCNGFASLSIDINPPNALNARLGVVQEKLKKYKLGLAGSMAGLGGIFAQIFGTII